MEAQILQAAERLFMQKGYALTSTTEIAHEAGCTQAMVHYYFRTKEKLFLKIFLSKLPVILETFTPAAGEEGEEGKRGKGGTFSDLVRQLTRQHFDTLRGNPDLPFLILNEIVTSPERIAAFIKGGEEGIAGEVFGRMRRECEQAVQRGEIRPVAYSDVLITMISVNVAPFLGRAVIRSAMGLDEAGWERFLDHRREEHIRIIENYIRP